MRQHKRGITLIALIVGVMVSALVLIGAAYSFSFFDRASRKDMASASLDVDSDVLYMYLHSHIGGDRGFQRLSLRIPSGYTASGSEMGAMNTGLIVEPDRDFGGNTGTGITGVADRIFFVERVPLAEIPKLTGAIGKGTTPTIVLDRVVSNTFSSGDIAVISDIENSEILKILSQVSPTGYPNQVNVDANSGSFDYNYVKGGTEGIQNDSGFDTGSYLYKAKITVLGLDPSTKELKRNDLGSSTSTVVARDVSSFRVFFNLVDCGCANICNALNCHCVSTPCGGSNTYDPNLFQNDWTTLNNSEPSGEKCYQRVLKFRIQYTLEQTNSGPAVIRKEKKFDFSVNL